MAKYNAKAALRGIDQTIKDYANIRAERTKIMGDMLANELKSKQNWFYRNMKSIAWGVLNKKKESGEKLTKQQQLQLDSLGEDLYGIKSQYSINQETKSKLNKFIEDAAREGIDIKVNSANPINKQYANAMTSYAAKRREKDKTPTTTYAFDAKRAQLDKDFEAGLITKEQH